MCIRDRATGEEERMVCFPLPPGSASVLRAPPGFSSHDEPKHCLQWLTPSTGAKDAPGAFSLKLGTIARGLGLEPTIYDEEFERSPCLLIAKHVEDINVAGVEETIDKYV
eukprot:9212447-Pyramimonas_sp.AAC.1